MTTSEQNIDDVIERFFIQRVEDTLNRVNQFQKARRMHADIYRRFGEDYARFFLRGIFLIAMGHPEWDEQEVLVTFAESLPNPDAN